MPRRLQSHGLSVRDDLDQQGLRARPVLQHVSAHLGRELPAAASTTRLLYTPLLSSPLRRRRSRPAAIPASGGQAVLSVLGQLSGDVGCSTGGVRPAVPSPTPPSWPRRMAILMVSGGPPSLRARALFFGGVVVGVGGAVGLAGVRSCLGDRCCGWWIEWRSCCERGAPDCLWGLCTPSVFLHDTPSGGCRVSRGISHVRPHCDSTNVPPRVLLVPCGCVRFPSYFSRSLEG